MKIRGKSASARTSVVAEIGNGWFKLAEVTVQRGGTVITRLHTACMPGGQDVSPAAFVTAAQKLDIPCGPVVAFLPREVVTVRLLDLPSVEPRELADMIDLQVDKQTPYSSDEILSEFRVLHTDAEGYSKVMLVIVQRSIVRHRFYVLEEAGFDVSRMSISSEGLLGWYTTLSGEFEKGTGCDAILDVDYSCSDFAVIDDGGLCYTGSIRIGARDLQADPEKNADALCRDVERSLAAFGNESAGPTIGRLLLTGATDHTGPLLSRLDEACDFPVEAVPATRGVELGCDVSGPDSPGSSVFSLAPLVGILTRSDEDELNLVPEPVKMRNHLVTKAGSLHALGVRVMAVFLLICVVLVAKLDRRQAMLDHVSRQLAATEEEARELERMKLKTQVVTQRMDTRLASVNIVRELHRLVLDMALHLTYLEVDGTANVTLRGSAQALSDVIKFVGMLEDSPLFAGVKNPRTTQKKGTTDFEIVCTLEKK